MTATITTEQQARDLDNVLTLLVDALDEEFRPINSIHQHPLSRTEFATALMNQLATAEPSSLAQWRKTAQSLDELQAILTPDIKQRIEMGAFCSLPEESDDAEFDQRMTALLEDEGLDSDNIHFLENTPRMAQLLSDECPVSFCMLGWSAAASGSEGDNYYHHCNDYFPALALVNDHNICDVTWAFAGPLVNGAPMAITYVFHTTHPSTLAASKQRVAAMQAVCEYQIKYHPDTIKPSLTPVPTRVVLPDPTQPIQIDADAAE